MAGEDQGDNKTRKRKQRYLPHNRPVKKRGSNPLRPGLQGFFITCDGGKERQASHEAINVIDSFLEELVDGKCADAEEAEASNKSLNKKIKFTYSDSSDGEVTDEEDDNDNEEKVDEGSNRSEIITESATITSCPGNGKSYHQDEDQRKLMTDEDEQEVEQCEGSKTDEIVEPPAKKQCTDGKKLPNGSPSKYNKQSVDRLIEAELEELGDKSKRRFAKSDSGCNGVVFISMRKREGDPGPKEIVQHMMESAAANRKHMSRFLLRVLPIEVTCYSSEEEISRAIKPTIAHHFPVEAGSPIKFAVLYEARANSGIDRMKIIDTVAKSVPDPHKVNLKDPEKTIVVQIVKTICLIGVVEKYKELAKYNFRQLTSPKQ
ncbi:hypothetical protein Dimus_021444 [Dionaea muscipula]